MKNFIIPEQVLVAAVNYLGTKPYSEVSQLIAALSQLQPVPEVPEVNPETKEADKK